MNLTTNYQASGSFEADSPREPEKGTPLSLWCITDFKPGHWNQIRGLTEALADLLPIRAQTLPAPSRLKAFGDWMSKRFSWGSRHLDSPDLIICAGHRTHLPALAARRACGGRVVALMKPSLPLSWFDLCLIPEHDHVAARSNVVLTRGVLNAVPHSRCQEQGKGLFLVGGPSDHYGWSDEKLVEQIRTIVQQDKHRQWTLTTSRRTPSSFLNLLQTASLANLEIVPCEQTSAGWVPQHLQKASQVWVSRDSVSMVYESLTAGAAVGLLQVPFRQESRVSRGLERLIQQECVTTFEQWQSGRKLERPPLPFHEAGRCAALIYEKWFRDERKTDLSRVA